MVKQRVKAVRGSESWVPVPEDELGQAELEEIATRVRRLKHGEGTTTSHEEFMKEMGLEDLLEQV